MNATQINATRILMKHYNECKALWLLDHGWDESEFHAAWNEHLRDMGFNI
jgi:hypothetical protein